MELISSRLIHHSGMGTALHKHRSHRPLPKLSHSNYFRNTCMWKLLVQIIPVYLPIGPSIYLPVGLFALVRHTHQPSTFWSRFCFCRSLFWLSTSVDGLALLECTMATFIIKRDPLTYTHAGTYHPMYCDSKSPQYVCCCF